MGTGVGMRLGTGKGVSERRMGMGTGVRMRVG